MRSEEDLDISDSTLIILDRYNINSVSRSVDIINRRQAPGQQSPQPAPTISRAPGRRPTRGLHSKNEGDDMDAMLRMLLGSHRWDVAQREYPRVDRAVDRSSIPVMPRTMKARENGALSPLASHTFGTLDCSGANGRLHTLTEDGFRNALRRDDRQRCDCCGGATRGRRAVSEARALTGDQNLAQRNLSIIEREGPLDEESTVGRRVDHTASP